MSYTARAQLALVLAPVWLPLALVANLLLALVYGAGEIVKTAWEANYDLVVYGFYRRVWRVARYGSVHDQ